MSPRDKILSEALCANFHFELLLREDVTPNHRHWWISISDTQATWCAYFQQIHEDISHPMAFWSDHWESGWLVGWSWTRN